MRVKPAWFRQDLLALLDLLREGKIRPLIAARLPLEDARGAYEMLGEGVLGKIVLLPTASGQRTEGRGSVPAGHPFDNRKVLIKAESAAGCWRRLGLREEESRERSAPIHQDADELAARGVRFYALI